MKIMLLSFILISLNVAAQSVERFFLMLPEEIVHVPMSNRKVLLKIPKSKHDEMGNYVEVVNKSSGYLKWYCYGGDGDGQLCVWRVENSPKKIVAGVKGQSATDYYQDLPIFFLWNGKKLVKMNGISISLKDFLKDNAKKHIPIEPEFYTDLPHKGNEKYIIITINVASIEDDVKYNYSSIKKYLRGDTIKLIWKNDHFEKGKPYF